MPTYTRRCPSCGTEYETFEPIDAPAPPCPTPDCDGTPERIITARPFVLKGGRWAADNYGGGGE